MRVYIGPYISRWISHFDERWLEWRYKDYYWNIDEDQYDRWDRLAVKIDDTLQWVYNHTINLYLDNKDRKIDVRVDRYDAWSADHTLALIILPVLKELQKSKHGSPFTDDEDVPENLRSTNAAKLTDEQVSTGHVDEFHHDRWVWVLEEMIWAFEQKCRDWWEEDYIIEHPEIDYDNKEKVEYDGETYYELKWKKKGIYDLEGQKAHQKRMSNGFRLFGKYFENLWS
jgi:hypothetical protein